MIHPRSPVFNRLLDRIAQMPVVDCHEHLRGPEHDLFGGDYFLSPEHSVAHLMLAREVIAAALADLIESGWLEEEETIGIAAGWLYNNPNRFYRLGLPEFVP
ncbi:MAG: hypothetical protein DDG58_10115 [Ardenticatenia bacterium]|jgi:hypothetical protein|nr:MAG: hypothetical protein DDG58_10115 [Ardenticatenia bacterium]